MPSMKVRPRVDETGGFDAIKEARAKGLVSDDHLIHLTNTIEVGTLDGGMTSGKPSVAFCFTLPDERVVVAETSLELFVAAARALAAAHE
jgi:hypothetical protein